MALSSLQSWLGRDELDIFATVTLRKCRWYTSNDSYFHLKSLDSDEVRKVGWLLRDRVSKAAHGSRAFKNKMLPPFLTFYELSGDNRPHFHILTSKPTSMSDEEYRDLFNSTASRLEWVYDQIDVRAIRSGDVERVISYSLKTGSEAFITEASFIPQYA